MLSHRRSTVFFETYSLCSSINFNQFLNPVSMAHNQLFYLPKRERLLISLVDLQGSEVEGFFLDQIVMKYVTVHQCYF